MKGFKEFKERFMSDAAFAKKFKGAQTDEQSNSATRNSTTWRAAVHLVTSLNRFGTG